MELTLITILAQYGPTFAVVALVIVISLLIRELRSLKQEISDVKEGFEEKIRGITANLTEKIADLTQTIKEMKQNITWGDTCNERHTAIAERFSEVKTRMDRIESAL